MGMRHPMHILLLGSGGREHALAWKIAASPLVTKLWCAPGNAGIAREAECVALDIANHAAVIEFCKQNAVERSLSYGDVYHQNEVEQSIYNFEQANAPELFRLFAFFESEAKRLLEARLALPGYEMILKAAHTFNLLDARGAISVTERQAYIGRIRALSKAVAQAYYESREALGFPMLPSPAKRS